MSDDNALGKMNERLWKLRLVLDETVEFPTEYLFKFIVPKSEVHHVLALLDGMDIDERASANGNYISVSAKSLCQTSDEIIQVYKKVSTIKGLLAL
jgi:putative lipoic acid-binding regulatory protein